RGIPHQGAVSHHPTAGPGAQRGHGLSPARHQPSARWSIAPISDASPGEILMGFLTPWFLAGAVGAGLPIYLHLLRRHRTTPLPFSSLMFFEVRTQSSIKHRRLLYLLLLAFRLAVILLLALAFATPFIERFAASVGGE